MRRINQPFEPGLEGPLPFSNGDALRIGPVEDDASLSGAELLPRRREIDLEVTGHGAHDRGPPAALVLDDPPGLDRPLVDAERGVGNHELFVHLRAGPEPVAFGTHSEGRVERKELRRELGERDPAVVAGLIFREQEVGSALALDDEDPGALPERGLDRVRQPRARALRQLGFGHQTVEHDLDVVFLLLVEVDVLLERVHLGIHPYPREAGAARFLEKCLVLPFPIAHQRRQYRKAGPFRKPGELVDDLLRGLSRHRPATAMTGEPPDSGEEDTEVVVDLGDGADGGARVVRGRLLIDGDRGREAADGVVERLLHLAQELAGVARERLDVAALALGVERVEGEGRLARSRNPAEDHELLLRDLDGDVLEVVLPRSADDDPVRLHDGWRLARRELGTQSRRVLV
jgi:hypothetical protein